MNASPRRKSGILVLLFAMLASILAACGGSANAPASAPTAAPSGDTSGTPVTLKTVGFEVIPEEKDSPLDQAYKKFLADFQAAHPNVTIESLETPPEFDTQLLVDLAAGTAPDVWQQDASTLARLVDSNYVQDMRQCVDLVPELNLDRFFPAVLEIHKRPDGAIYGLPNDFTPMVLFYNTKAFENAKVQPPAAGWTWDDLLKISQELTLDNQGRNRLDPNFDENNVVQWGFRVRQYSFEWIYRLWENGTDVLSPDGTTATGYLDSPKSIETLQWLADMVLKYKVSPPPTTLDQMTQSLGFNDRFLKGEFALFDRGHWEIFGLTNNKEFQPNSFAVVGQPKKENAATVIYESSWVIRNGLEGDQLKAACQFVEAATNRQYQDTKNITGIAIAANQESANVAAANAKYPELEKVFVQEVANGRPPYGAKYAKWPAIETILDSMMERVLAGNPVEQEVKAATEEINRELGTGQ